MSSWRMAGLNYVNYSNIAARVLRQSVKGAKKEDSKTSESFMRYSFWANGEVLPEGKKPMGDAKDKPDDLLKDPKIGMLFRKKDGEVKLFTKYTSGPHKQPLINIVDECLKIYFLSYIGRPGFPFVEELQRFMLSLREAGLTEIYDNWSRDMLHVPKNLPKIRNEPRPFNSTKLEHLRLAFGFLFLGQCVSSFTFLIEVWRKRTKVRHRYF